MKPKTPFWSGNLAGSNFHPGWKLFGEDETAVWLVAEPENKYDPRAIAVMSEHGKIGYVPKMETGPFHNLGEVPLRDLKVTVKRDRPFPKMTVELP